MQSIENASYGPATVKSSLPGRSLWGALLSLAMTVAAVPAHARAHHSEAWARDHFAAAERMREALNGRPPADRTRHDFQRVVNAYRNIYFGAPASTKADPSVVAVAETLVEMGRRFNDDKILNEAIAQYKFLRREYPGSKYRFDALFTAGEIYKDDLNDPDAARSAFEEFLRRYPHHRLADDARQAIGQLDKQAKAEKTAKAAQSTQPARTAQKANPEKNDKLAKEPAPAETNVHAADSSDESADKHAARVTGIRHWSTPDYTRIAIDVESDVTFTSRRIADPDRIFFDLRGTKLASTLVGKSFDVDEPFLKKIRVAQFQPGRTRVVLEVENLSDYDAFLLPDPYRLIIDIHGKDIRGRDIHGNDAKGRNARPKPETDGDDSSSGTGDTKAAEKTALLADSASNSVGPKSDLRSQVGKAPVTSMDVADDAKVSLPGAAGSNRKSQAAPVKKIVEADDNDDEDENDTPVRAATLDVPDGKRKASSSSLSLSLSSSLSPATAASKKQTADDPDGHTNPSATGSPAAGRSGTSHSQRSSASTNVASRKSQTASGLDIREAKPTASGDRSLIRALGLKIGKIVIDSGHGGHDTGTVGPNGLEEKDLVLDVGKRLGKLLETRLGAEVVYTRKDDTFIPLETRTAIANQARADLFISIHANSSHDSSARGVETYYLNFTSSPEALEVAARENAVSEKSIYELQDLVKKIALKEKIEESHEFASDVQESLHSGLAAKSSAIRDRGVKKAPFIVLIGANMPSILAEISFVSNPTDEHRLETGEYRQRIAESLYRGIAKYANGLSGVKVASRMDKAAGQ